MCLLYEYIYMYNNNIYSNYAHTNGQIADLPRVLKTIGASGYTWGKRARCCGG